MTSFDDLPARSVTGEVAIRAVIRHAHLSAAQDPISWPDSDGAFPDAHLPIVLPVVIDANALRDEIIRVGKPRTILANAANSGVLRLYCAPHVIEDVSDHYAEWALDARVSPDEVWELWVSTYVPLLRCVNDCEGLTDATETTRLAILGTAGHPDGDPDDVPSAALSLVLGAPLLSRDRCPLVAVYGQGFDHLAHAKWFEKLRAGGDLGPGGTMANLSTNLVVGTGIGGYRGMSALAAKFGWPAVALSALGAAAAFHLAASPETKGRVGSALGRGAAMTLDLLTAVFAVQQAAQARFDELARPEPDWQVFVEELGSHRALQRACLYSMARSPQSTLNAVDVAALVSIFPLPARGETRVRSALRSLPNLHEPTHGRFQLGSPTQPSRDVNIERKRSL